MSEIKNPIIPGYYPDPSICRVGDDFYLACSSFELYPGIPLFHSKDLMHWEQICNIMTADNDFHIEESYGANGVMAPTLRYCNGIFYIINANFSDKGNFIVTAEDPAGPWSQPHYLDDVPGIDASLFFDDDGKCYVIGTGNVWDNGTGVMERGIWLAPYDIENFRMAGEPVTIFNSALRGAASPESPHVYHIGDYYYLIIAEGGTEHYHSVAVARSKELFGFYENNPANPIMTHRMMGTRAKIMNVGHADIVDTPDGKWYAVMLASRAIEGKYKSLGRETYLCPVEWEWDWPLFSPETGLLQLSYEGTGLPETVYEPEAAFDDFDSETPALYWTFWGRPYSKYYKFGDSRLDIRCIARSLVTPLEPVQLGIPRRFDHYKPYIARRQREFDFTAATEMTFTPADTESAGLALVQAFNHQYHFERAVVEGRQVLQVVLYTADFQSLPFLPGFESETHREVVASVPYDAETVVLQVVSKDKEYIFSYGASKEELQELITVDATLINPEKVGCMAGTMIGMYATGNGKDSDNKASFDWFSLEQ
ncbi:MAG: glycoside hydrolase family 43 protein [Eubacteriales bacterium]|nr:glycoside hydrolase family 43 protein [Eubacteriales bacterium]